MSNDMKTIMESWRDLFKEWDFSTKTTLKRIGKDGKSGANLPGRGYKDIVKGTTDPERDAASRYIAKQIGKDPKYRSGTLRPGTLQGYEDVENLLNLQKDILNAMSYLDSPFYSVDKPEDIPMGLLINLIENLSMVRGVSFAGNKLYKSWPKLIKWFRKYITKNPNVVLLRHKNTPEHIKAFAVALGMFLDDAPELYDGLRQESNYLAQDLFEETKK